MGTNNSIVTKKPRSSPLSLIWELFSAESKEIGVIFTYEIGVGILSLTIPIGVQVVVNTVAFTQLVQPVVFLSAAVLLGQLMGAFLRGIQVVLVEKLQRRLFSQIGMELAFRIPRMLRQRYSRFPELVNRFFDIVTIQKSVSSLVIEGFALVLQIIISLVLLAFYHPMLLAFDVFLVISILFILFVLGKGALETSIEESKQKYLVAAWLEEISTKSVTFSSRSARFFAMERANDFVGAYLTARESHFRIVFRQVLGFLGLQAIANTVLLFVGVWLIIHDQLSIGQLVAAEIVVSTMLYSLSRFQKHLESFYDLVAAMDKVSNLMDQPMEPSGSDSCSPEGPAELEVRELSYTYPSLKKTFGPVSFTLQSGMRMAVHGSNGSGKSTLIDLLYGFKQPVSGLVLFNKDDIRTLNPEIYREHVALVRGVEIVHGSIIKNMRLGKPSASVKEIKSALLQFGLLEDIMSLPRGIETILTDQGEPLSVAQIKRFMLARAMLGRPELLIIDETLDGLDDRSREQALDIIFDTDAPWSVLITSQHPDVEKRCDEVLNLDLVSNGGSSLA